jgi:hypothetical protein
MLSAQLKDTPKTFKNKAVYLFLGIAER